MKHIPVSKENISEGYLVIKQKQTLRYVESGILSDPYQLSVLSDAVRLRILSLLNKKPSYAAELAKNMKLNEQKVYYHINKLIKAGFLEVSERKEIRGTIAKVYVPKRTAFSFLLNGHPPLKPLAALQNASKPDKLKSFLSPFIKEEEFRSVIVVGNPDPHGQHKARARDGHFAIDLALFLGKYSSLPETFPVSLDVNLKSPASNLIIVGGPITNLLASELNPHLPVRFTDEKPFGLFSSNTGKTYTDPNIGMIARIPSPFIEGRFVLFLSGIGLGGTKAAVLAITRHHEAILSSYAGQKRFVKVIQGFDMDGDGSIDSIEIVE